jgi:hypothetical protein
VAFCTNCGTATNADQRFCTVCGHALTSSSLTPAPVIGPGPSASSPARVGVGLAHEAPRQSRLSVLGRMIIAIPLFLWLTVLVFAGIFVTVGAWFAALVTGRVPDGMQGFLTRVLRFSAKTTAYTCLLTARWPGMNIDPGPRDQMSLEIDHVPLNRAAVLFRLVLVVPSSVVAAAMNLGTILLTFVMWVCALVRGRVPQPLHEARGLAWRFRTRTSAYVQLLTPTQPFDGFFGDPGASATTNVLDESFSTSPRLSTTWTMSTWGRVFFIVTLLSGAYFQLQPGITRWPVAYVADRTVGRTFVTAINDSVTYDLSGYQAPGGSCARVLGAGCTTDAAAVAHDLDRQWRNLRAFEPFVVEGRQEYLAYEHQVLVIELTLEQLASATANGSTATLAELYATEVDALTQMFPKLHAAI